MTRKGRRCQIQQDKKLAAKKPVTKEVSANDAAPSNVNDDNCYSLSDLAPVPSALKQHRTKLHIISKKTPHPKAPAKWQVATYPCPTIAFESGVRAIPNASGCFADSGRGHEAATLFIAATAGDIMAICKNGGVETGEADEIADDAANKSREPVRKKWPVVMGNGVAYRIRKECTDA